MKQTLAAVLATLLTGCGSRVTKETSNTLVTNIPPQATITAYEPQPFLGVQIASNYYYQGMWSGILIGFRLAKDRFEGIITNEDVRNVLELRAEQHMSTNEIMRRVREIEAQ